MEETAAERARREEHCAELREELAQVEAHRKYLQGELAILTGPWWWCGTNRRLRQYRLVRVSMRQAITDLNGTIKAALYLNDTPTQQEG